MTGGHLVEAGISEKKVKKFIDFQARLGDGRLLEYGHLLEFLQFVPYCGSYIGVDEEVLIFFLTYIVSTHSRSSKT